MQFLQQRKKQILLAIAPLPILLILWLLFVKATYLLIILSSYYGCLLLFHTAKGLMYREDDLKRGKKYAFKWWADMRHEDLSTLEAWGTVRYFGKEKFAAYKVYRGSESSSSKSYLPLILVVKLQPTLEMMTFVDSPTPEDLENPFVKLGPVHIGSPSPTLTPESEPGLMWRAIKTREKPVSAKEEEIEILPESSESDE